VGRPRTAWNIRELKQYFPLAEILLIIFQARGSDIPRGLLSPICRLGDRCEHCGQVAGGSFLATGGSSIVFQFGPGMGKLGIGIYRSRHGPFAVRFHAIRSSA
jgi:hypothetical protein